VIASAARLLTPGKAAACGASTACLSVARNSVTRKGLSITPANPAALLRADVPARASSIEVASAVNIRTGSSG
jgi:hypothetical protein